MASSKVKILTNKGKSPTAKLGQLGMSSKKSRSPLMPGQKKNYSKTKLPEQAFAIPGFGDTGLTGES